MEKIISHMADKELTMRCLDMSTQEGVSRKQFALEFCHAFGVKVGIPPSDSPSEPSVFRALKVFTPEGLPVGDIALGQQNGDLYYKYSASHIRKEKASARSDKSSRDSNKIAGLLAAIKRNNEEPTANRVATHPHLRDAVRFALSSIKSGPSVDMRLGSHIVSEFIKSFMNVPNVLESYRTEIVQTFDEYKQRMGAKDERLANFNRYLEGGFKVVFVHNPSSSHHLVAKALHVIADGTATDDESDKISLSNLRGVNDFSDDPNLDAVAMMARTYMDGKNLSSRGDNLFHIFHGDTYHEDIDIATGYANHDWLAVLIPKKAP